MDILIHLLVGSHLDSNSTLHDTTGGQHLQCIRLRYDQPLGSTKYTCILLYMCIRRNGPVHISRISFIHAWPCTTSNISASCLPQNYYHAREMSEFHCEFLPCSVKLSMYRVKSWKMHEIETKRWINECQILSRLNC